MQGARSKASSASGQRRGGRQRHGSGQGFVLEGRAAPIHPKPGQMSPQQWQAWEQQQQQMMLMASGQYPVFGQYATHDGSSPRAGDAPSVAQLIQQGAQGQHAHAAAGRHLKTRTALSPHAPASQPHLLACCMTATAALHALHTPHTGDHNQILAAYVAQRAAAAGAESPTHSGSGSGSGQGGYIYQPGSPGAAVWRSPSTAAEGVFVDWDGCLSRQGSSALGPPSR